MAQNFYCYWSIEESWLSAMPQEMLADMWNFDQRERQKVVYDPKTGHNLDVWPHVSQVFSWTSYFPIKDTKVVILGQDPYPTAGHAHGLSFSVPVGVNIPPSLRNIFKELENDNVSFWHPNHGNLSGWAKQGVLLLNSVLTVRQSQPNSHKDQGWEDLTDAVISWISANLHGVVFMLWGKYAQKKGSKINRDKHLVLSAAHPSPLSAFKGFFGCKHFSKANEFLKNNRKDLIDWSVL